MAGGGWVLLGTLQVLIITTILYKQIIPTPTSEFTGTYQDYFETIEPTQLYSYRKLQNFSGVYYFVRSVSTFSVRGASSVGEQVALNNDDRYRNTSGYGTFSYILINLLARSGDIEPNPGPSNKCNKRNINRANEVSTSAVNCEKCHTVTMF